MWIRCLKKKYDKKGAQGALNKILQSCEKNSKKHKRNKEKRIYHCNLCNAWHLTSKDYEEYDDIKIEINEKLFEGWINRE